VGHTGHDWARFNPFFKVLKEGLGAERYRQELALFRERGWKARPTDGVQGLQCDPPEFAAYLISYMPRHWGR
jgi:hypothetical protein